MSTFIALNMIQGTRQDEDGLDVEQTQPCVINASAIRCYYARREGKPGTRLTFIDGGGFAVSETPDVVASLVAPLAN